MSPELSLNQLLEYTDWERQQWHEWLRSRGDYILAISVGPHGDGRFKVIGDVIKHIFSAEKRYVDRLSNRPLTDTASVPNNSVAALFEFGEHSRRDMKTLIEQFPADHWDILQEFTLMNSILIATPKKIVSHALLHEIRHWAQVATLLRFEGLTGEFHDFLFSPVLGGEIRKQVSGR